MATRHMGKSVFLPVSPLAVVLLIGSLALSGCAAVTTDKPGASAGEPVTAANRFSRLAPGGSFRPGSQVPAVAAAVGTATFAPVVSSSFANGVSPALRDLPKVAITLQVQGEEHELGPVHAPRPVPPGFVDPVWQSSFAPLAAAPAPLANFEGQTADDSGCGCIPPDTNGVVGPTQYVQMVNSSLAVFSKTGTRLSGPTKINALFNALPSAASCRVNNDGDPIVVYDQLADRWLVSQFAHTNGATLGYHECIAISQTGDATGAYFVYDFLLGPISPEKFHDYPHIGVWPDGYYMSTHQFDPSNYIGAGAFSFERAKMLAGQPAQFVYFNLNTANPGFGGHLPANLDGPTLPPAGAPNYFVEVDDNAEISGPGGSDAMRIWKFHVDWTTPANSTFGLNGQPNFVVPVANFSRSNCNLGAQIDQGTCVPQPASETQLDPIGDRLMYRLAYRNFGDHEALVVNHTVVANGNTLQHGPRWYEVRDPGGSPTIFQQGTLAPTGATDLLHRWMGSIAMDHSGNIAMGYSTSSNSNFPSIAYSGRLVTDPLGQMAQGETQMFAGGASENPFLFVGVGLGRWGDYSDMTVDPTDDCTFWYTTEYFPTPTDPFTIWHTRIGSFKFPQCTNNRPPVAAITATPSSGTAPLTVMLDASGSTDPDAGDSIASYFFHFGDGAADVMQATPTISHRYSTAQTYNASVSVKDSHGLASAAIATTPINVTAATTAPAPFTYIERVNVPVNAFVTSEAKTVTGSGGPWPVSISGGTSPQYSINGAAFTAAAGNIASGATLSVRHVSASAENMSVTSTVNVGSYSTPFKSTTTTLDRVPDAFDFGSQSGLNPSVLVESAVITLMNFDVASIVAGPDVDYRIDGGSYTRANGTLKKGQTLQVRHTTNSAHLGYTKTYLKVGGVTGYFTTRTK